MDNIIDSFWLHKFAVAATCFTFHLGIAASVAHVAGLGLPWNVWGNVPAV